MDFSRKKFPFPDGKSRKSFPGKNLSLQNFMSKIIPVLPYINVIVEIIWQQLVPSVLFSYYRLISPLTGFRLHCSSVYYWSNSEGQQLNAPMMTSTLGAVDRVFQCEMTEKEKSVGHYFSGFGSKRDTLSRTQGQLFEWAICSILTQIYPRYCSGFGSKWDTLTRTPSPALPQG